MDTLGLLGLAYRRETARPQVPQNQRTWGAETDGFMLSASEIRDSDSGSPALISLAIRNCSDEERKLAILPWLVFYRLEIKPADLTAYGRRLLDNEATGPRITISLAPGQIIETGIPIGNLYSLQKGRQYAISASCTIPASGAVLVSNEILLVI